MIIEIPIKKNKFSIESVKKTKINENKVKLKNCNAFAPKIFICERYNE